MTSASAPAWRLTGLVWTDGGTGSGIDSAVGPERVAGLALAGR